MARGDVTVSDIAHWIAFRGRKPTHSVEEVVQPIVERLRHWTRERLLTPLPGSVKDGFLGALHPGTGRAAILNALADEGATVRQLKIVIDALDGMNRSQRKLWDLAKTEETQRAGDPSERIFLVVTMAEGGRSELIKGFDRLWLWFEGHYAVTVIDLSKTMFGLWRVAARPP
jgi:hypothetical protein